MVAEAQAVESWCLFEKISYPNGCGIFFISFYSHVNFSVTKICFFVLSLYSVFYSHVNFSVTKILNVELANVWEFYSHVNFSVTKMRWLASSPHTRFTVT